VAKGFTKQPKQVEATDLMCKHMYTLLYGGRRSGKTFIFIRNLITRALHVKSRHVVLRLRFSHIKRSIWHETLPDVLSICYPQLKEGVHYILNKSDYFIKFQNGSTIWIGGLDDKDRTQKVLGTEYSTGYLNECSQIGYDGYEMVLSGLAENSGLTLKIYLDCNPPSKKHWTYKLFFEGVNPEDNKPLKPDYFKKFGQMRLNPHDNKTNLADGYLDVLDNMSRRKRERFRDGLFASDVEGALWSADMINLAQLEPGEEWVKNPLQTIVALDPNVSDGSRSDSGEFEADEAGIVVISKDGKSRDAKGKGQIEADYSGEYSTVEWAKKAIWAYYTHNADGIIYEKNQGGALVKNTIRATKGGATIPLHSVWASKGKFARAEPTTVLYEQDKIKHKPGLDKLEDELQEYVPGKSDKSPNRLDAAVWGLTYLFLNKPHDNDNNHGVIF
jgi:phage terminase large subunit-like protein